jgi:hypothetical protein
MPAASALLDSDAGMVVGYAGIGDGGGPRYSADHVPRDRQGIFHGPERRERRSKKPTSQSGDNRLLPLVQGWQFGIGGFAQGRQSACRAATR